MKKSEVKLICVGSRLDTKTYTKLKQLARREKRTISDYLRIMIESALQKEKGE